MSSESDVLLRCMGPDSDCQWCKFCELCVNNRFQSGSYSVGFYCSYNRDIHLSFLNLQPVT